MTTTESLTPSLDVQGKVATITLRRPAQANRLSNEDLALVLEHVNAVNAMDEVLVLQFRGQGKYFCSGYDIRSIGGERSIAFDEVVNAVEDARPVTLVVLHGGVYGGGTDLSLACDFRVGAPATNMFMPAARLGLHFYQRGMERYVSRLGLNTAKRLFLTAEHIDANEMKACGFLTHLVAANTLEQAVDDLTDTLCSMAPLAVLGMKKHLNRMATGKLDVDDLDRDIARAARSEDLKEGGAAWAEKRKPVFKGR
jgi:enoyl-CoA hydratase